ncbi:hypothetical protein GHK46_28135 [Sinorhizobium medicae]|uniref:hypothetical protein n=1 Tax=Sinorhizobium medicae TaxID=110321 RepID=UPI0012952785|nr:hypothetical protein [Sinorhizobium medicae]MQW01053.1 hypothetical protein [Sinorhizobium medicae]
MKLIVLLLSLLAASGPASAYNMYNITKDEFKVPVSRNIGANVILGAGINMDDPNDPVLAPNRPFSGEEELEIGRERKKLELDQILSSTTQFIENTSDYEFARVISVSMKGAFSFASAEAAYSFVKNRRISSHVIMSLITNTVTSPQLNPQNIKWSTPPSSEAVPDPDVLRQFVSGYGSHYVQSISYGYKVAVFGSITSSLDEEKSSFSAAFKVAFTGGGGGGSVSDAQKALLRQTNVDLRAEITAGDIEPNNSAVLTGFDQILKFLEGIRVGHITIYRGPVEIVAKNYWFTLTEYPRTRAVLALNQGDQVEAPYGVPRGTIIAWYPQNNSLRADSNGAMSIVVPNGWAICNGEQNTPDLTDHFIQGTYTPEELGAAGGSAAHTHRGNTTVQGASEFLLRPSNAGGPPFSLWATVGHKHNLRVREASHLPPFVKVIFLMKL